MSKPIYRFRVDRECSSSCVRLLPWWALLAGAAVACTDGPTNVDSPAGPSLGTITRNVVTPDSLTVAVGGTATATCQPLDSTNRPRNCIWTSRDTSVATVVGSGTQTGTITGRKQGNVWVIASATKKKDSVSVTVGAGSPTDPPPTDPPPTDPPPTDPPPTDPPLPPPSALLTGCPASGYLRLVDVNTSAELSSALSAASPGDQIRIAAGTYSGARSLSRSGTLSNPITICGVAGAHPILKGGQWSSTGSYLTYTGLIFEGAAVSESVNPVYVHSSHHVAFTGNELRGGHYHAALSLDEIHDVTVSYNYVHDNGGTDASHDHGIYLKTTTGTGNKVVNNVVVHNVARGISLHDNTLVGVYDVLVANNTVAHNGSNGILINNGDRNILANNVVTGNGDQNSATQIRIVSTAGSNNLITHNLTYSTTSGRAGIANEAGAIVTGNVIAVPEFVASYSDLHLQAGSPAIGLALTNYMWGVDYDGQPRDAAPDAGAFER
jgi:parallel beta-helix repeat protein